MKELKFKSGFKKCPICKNSTCLVYIQNETEDDFAEISESCHSCGHEHVVYSQELEKAGKIDYSDNKEALEAKQQLKGEKRRQQLRDSQAKTRTNKKNNGIERKEFSLSQQQINLIEKHGLDTILTFFEKNI